MAATRRRSLITVRFQLRFGGLRKVSQNAVENGELESQHKGAGGAATTIALSLMAYIYRAYQARDNATIAQAWQKNRANEGEAS